MRILLRSLAAAARRGYVLIIAFLLYAPYCHAAANDPGDVAAIRQVVERFGAAFSDKDIAAFTELFYSARPEEVIWQFVVEDARLARIQKFKPEARKARRVPDNNYLTAIKAIAADPLPVEEKNWGREMWHLVRTDQGWKIISVIFSARDPLPKEKQPSVR